ncbi:cupin domain-containing protein [Mesorhizobium sp. ES1-1]|uniref:cupin domain-containing protein n=1 Tax=Mesorhizobium sp. ES1-1 TaxID=2876629 RepID=UPI001CCE55EA|nr:cupin domain-containing protein [Mesorhizobium sp. ES1-1]MBZ9678539.1 cupin [Mesorhizobium sp. ES1-1]
MPIIESAKAAIEQVTGWQRPSDDELDRLVRPRKANAFRFGDEGLIPNHPHWGLIVYRGAVKLPGEFDPAAVFEDLFGRNGWGSSWRDGIYDYVHYHSRIHEVLGIARGSGKVRFGGKRGRTFTLKAGDVAVLPSGTGHQRLSATGDFLVVGAYPPGGTYDECTGSEEHASAVKTIPKVARPRMDPVYGKNGPLLDLWKA